MHTLEFYSDYIEEALSSIPYPRKPEGLYAPVKYTLEGGGKRLRPTLLLASGEAFGASVDNLANQAMAIEMFHNFTLLHDDVMDNADVRRGRPTVHRRWNMETAILSGDAMLTMATMMVARCPEPMLPGVLNLFNTTAIEVYEGQQFDMDFENRNDVDVEEYMEMIRLKTAVLLACASAMGAILADADKEQVNAMYRFGEQLGMAFQLRDDYLDTYGDPTIFGKEIGGDIVNEKKTWLWITSMHEAGGQMRRVLDKKLTDYLKIKEITDIYNELNLPERTCRLIEEYVAKAQDEIRKTALSAEATAFFCELAKGCISRSH